MDEQPRPAEEMPKSLAERIRERPMLTGLISAVLVVVVGMAFSVATNRPDDSSSTGLEGFEPAEDSPADSEGPVANGDSDSMDTNAEGSGSDADATDTDGDSGSNEDGDDGDVPAPAPYVAYRLSGALYISAEDGSGAKKVAESAMGTFALSPDGTRLAYIDASEEILNVVDVNGTTTEIGSAVDVPVSWSPDSSHIAYTAKESGRLVVRVVESSGSGGLLIGTGHSPRISRDGKRIALIGGGVPGQVSNVVLADLDGENAGGVGIKASEITWGGDGLVFATSDAAPGEERIYTARIDGSLPRELIGAATEGKPVMYASLCASPNGLYITYAAHSDDGYSRAYVVRASSPSPVALSVRRDTYPLCWAADSAHVFFIEGNSFQGEQSNLMSAMPDGLGRVTVVEGAGL